MMTLSLDARKFAMHLLNIFFQMQLYAVAVSFKITTTPLLKLVDLYSQWTDSEGSLSLSFSLSEKALSTYLLSHLPCKIFTPKAFIIMLFDQAEFMPSVDIHYWRKTEF